MNQLVSLFDHFVNILYKLILMDWNRIHVPYLEIVMVSMLHGIT